jgi:hypothetical protein
MSYQAIYDAVRSKIHGGNISQAVTDAINMAGIGHHAHMASVYIQQVAAHYERPSVLYRPKVFMDGNLWCALYGENLQEGVAGFGDSPAAAMYDFDQQWEKKWSGPIPEPEGE